MSTRRQKAFTQNIFLLEMKPTKHQYTRYFDVIGTTGNIYTITINGHPSCTCYDNVYNGGICKHIYFILLRVMKISSNKVQSSWTTMELQEMFKNIPKHIDRNLVVDNDSAIKYEACFKEKKIVEQKMDDVCPVCLDDLGKASMLDYCHYSCGKSIHKKCYDIWCKANKNTKTCLFCQQLWD